jgi:hypothetical protein
MCDKCVDIDKAIERYRKIQCSIGDQITIVSMTETGVCPAVPRRFHPDI